MNRHPKRPRSPNPKHHQKAKRRRKSRRANSPQDPSLVSAVEKEANPAEVAALLALTDPAIVANILHFIPQSHSYKTHSNASSVLANLVTICRAMRPFDHNLPTAFGPHNEIFWREMVFQYYDFTTAEAFHLNELAVWPELGVCYQPSEYGFLSELQLLENRSAWPEDEDAFTLFCDLTLLVDKLAGCIVTKPTPEATQLVPCLLHPGATQPSIRSTTSLSPDQPKRMLRLPIREIRRSRRPLLVQIITKELQNWGKYTDASRQVECYAGRSFRSKRWLGFARFTPMATSHLEETAA